MRLFLLPFLFLSACVVINEADKDTDVPPFGEDTDLDLPDDSDADTDADTDADDTAADDTGETPPPPGVDEHGYWVSTPCEPNFNIPTADWHFAVPDRAPTPIAAWIYNTSGSWAAPTYSHWDEDTDQVLLRTYENATECVAWYWEV